MSKLNIERIAQLAGYRKLNETADYDFGGVEPRSQKVPFEPSKSGQADLPVRNVNLQGDNPLEEDDLESMEGTCEADPQFDGMDDEYLSAMIAMMQRAPVMASSEANMQWLAAANAELARRATFAEMQAKAEAEAATAAQAIVAPEPEQVSAPVGDVMIDRNGFPEHMSIVQDGRFFVIAKNMATGETETIPRDQWDAFVLDNNSMYDNVPVGDRLPQVSPETEGDDVVVLGIGEDEEVEEGIDWPEERRHSDTEWDDDEDEEELEEAGPSWAKQLAQQNKDRMSKERDEFKAQQAAQAEEKAAKQQAALRRIATKFQNFVADYPDGDPIYMMISDLEARGYDDIKAARILDKAVKEVLGVASAQKYVSDFVADYNRGDLGITEGVMDVIRQHVNPETLSKAHSVLVKAGIADTAIANRDVSLSASGYTKLAHILTGEAMSDMDAEDYCKHVLHALGDKLDCGETIDESEQLDEFQGMGGDQRFSYTVDTLGNVNLSDAMTGASLYLQGQDAQELLGELSIHGSTPEAEQAILGQYEHAMDNQVDADGNAADAFGF